MENSLIFDSNLVSEKIVNSYFRKMKINILGSFNEKADILSLVKLNEPEYIVIDYELYSDEFCDIICNVKEIVPQSKIIIVTNKINKFKKNKIKEYFIEDIFERPFIDADFIRLLVN